VSKNPKLLHGAPAVVLLAEDSHDDVELTRIAFEHADYLVDLRVTSDGEECLAFLRKQNAYGDAPTPDLILLDLHMPKMDGMEVLDAINADERLQHIPVVVLTTSTSERDIKEAYCKRCSGYLVKPVGFSEFSKSVQRLEEYWFSLVALPKH